MKSYALVKKLPKMKYEIAFDKKIYYDQTAINFNVAWNKNLKKNKRNLFFSILLIVLGFLIIYGKNKLGYPSLFVGIYYLIDGIRYLLFYKKQRDRYFDLVNSEMIKHEKAQETTIWEFNEDYFSYKDYKYEAKIKWNAFKGYRIINKNLFLDLEIGNASSYIIGAIEIGNEEFDKLLNFVERKIGDKTNA